MSNPFESEAVAPLIEEMQRLLPLPGNRVFRTLKKLEKEASALGDDRLAGFVRFYYALAYYSHDEHAKTHASLHRAIEHLMRAGDDVVLARAFNLFALDAQRYGCYDIARNYYRMAFSLIDDHPHSLIHAILNANIGNLLAESGNFREALRHTRRARSAVLKNRDDAMFTQNLIITYTNIALYALYSGNPGEAEKYLPRLEKMFRTGDFRATMEIGYLILRAAYAFLCDSKAEAAVRTDALVARLSEMPLYNEITFDLYCYCNLLLQHKAYKTAAGLIHYIEQSNSSETSCHRHMLLSDLVVEYYSKTKNSKALTAALEKQNELACRLWDEQKQVYQYSVDTMFLISKLREEQALHRYENEVLRSRAETDSLTGLPNRYAMNRKLTEALSQALSNNTHLGIGLVDIDAFKRYNDLYGHTRGDQCLRLVAEALRRIAEKHKIFVARYGGDEFVLIYDGRNNKQIRAIAKELKEQMPVKVTHGYYNTVPDETSLPFALLARADADMYRNRRTRKA